MFYCIPIYSNSFSYVLFYVVTILDKSGLLVVCSELCSAINTVSVCKTFEFVIWACLEFIGQIKTIVNVKKFSVC